MREGINLAFFIIILSRSIPHCGMVRFSHRTVLRFLLDKQLIGHMAEVWLCLSCHGTWPHVCRGSFLAKVDETSKKPKIFVLKSVQEIPVTNEGCSKWTRNAEKRTTRRRGKCIF